MIIQKIKLLILALISSFLFISISHGSYVATPTYPNGTGSIAPTITTNTTWLQVIHII